MFYEYGKPGSHFPVRRKQWEGVSRPLVMNQYTALLRKNISLVQPSVPIKQKTGKGERKKNYSVSVETRNSPIAKTWFHARIGDTAHTERNCMNCLKVCFCISKKEMEILHVEHSFLESCLLLVLRYKKTKRMISSSFLIWKFLLINTCKLHNTEVWY